MKSRSPNIFAVAALALALIGLTVTVHANGTPEIPKEVKVINGEQLKKMLDGKDKFLLVDSRIASEYRDGHIPKAINIVDKEMDAQKAKFPADKTQPIVFYCNGYPKCPRSANAAITAMGWGYKNLYVYTAGIPEWEQKGFPIERN